MTAPRVHIAPERALGRRWKHLSRDTSSRAAAGSNRIDDVARERAGLARDLAGACGERADVANARLGISAERRAIALERAEARVRDLEGRIAALDAEAARLKASQAGLASDANTARGLFEKFKRTLSRAVEPDFFDEMNS
jgi:hypothetical protein